MTTNQGSLAGKRILVIEDDFMIANHLAMVLAAHGAEIVGPAGTVQGGLTLVADAERIDGAILDVNLRGEMVYPVADALRRKGVPMVFLTGYDGGAAAAGHVDVPCLRKPAKAEQLIRALFG